MNGATSLAHAASRAGTGPFSAARARMQTPLIEKACESFMYSELVTFTLCARLHTVSETMNAIRSGFCQVECAAIATPTITANRTKKNAVQMTEGAAGG